MKKEELENLKALQKRMAAIAKANNAPSSKEGKMLRELNDQKELVDSLKTPSPERAKAINKLLDLGYQYYKLAGSVDPHSLPGIKEEELVRYYNRVHRVAFNLALQTHVHHFLVNMSVVLLQLENLPETFATNAQFENVREQFRSELGLVLQQGYALDLDEYQNAIEPLWLVIKMAKHLTADNFKALVKELDRYSRLRTGKENKVGYHPDKAHTKPAHKKLSDEELKHEVAKQRTQAEMQKKQQNRLQITKDSNDHLIVRIPTKTQAQKKFEEQLQKSDSAKWNKLNPEAQGPELDDNDSHQ